MRPHPCDIDRLRRVALRGSLLAALLTGPVLAVGFDDFGRREHISGMSSPPAGEARTIALQIDGSAVVGTSTGELLRYQDGGTPAGLLATVPPAHSGSRAIVGLAALPDGGLIIAASDEESYSLRRIRTNDNGAEFHGDGVVTGNPLRVDALAIQGDGGIVVGGQERVPLDGGGERWNYIVVRHHSDGLIDGSFADEGVMRLDLDNRQAADVLVAPLADGSVVIASTVRARSDPSTDILVARIDSSGTLDPSFGNSGALRLGDVDADERAAAVLVQPDGAVVVAGTYVDTESGVSSWVLFRLQHDSVVQSLGGASELMSALGDERSCSAAHALAQLPDQTLLVAGSIQAECGKSSNLLLLAVMPDGRVQAERALDLGGDEKARAIAVQPDGQVLLAGGDADHVELVRIALGDPAPFWDLEPDVFHFSNVNGVRGSALQVSEFRAVEEFDQGIYVPLRIAGGEYALNGSSQYTKAPGWVRLGDEISVRHVARARPQESETTWLIVGGIQPANNLALTLGPVAVLEFTSVTGTIPDDAGGGGALGLLVLVLFAPAVQHRYQARNRNDGHRWG